VFSLQEAADVRRSDTTDKPILALGPPTTLDPVEYQRYQARPAVSTLAQAEALRSADPILCVDTGMQRFSCPAEDIGAIVRSGACREAFTHATKIEHVRTLKKLMGGSGFKLQAAASSLLNEPEAWLDGVRPGLALYREAVKVWAPLVEVRSSRGPVGYSEFSSQRHGVIVCGYSKGLRKGPCLVNGQMRQIREVGMQSAFVEVGEEDRVGDEVVLLGDDLDPQTVAAEWACTPHEVLVRMGGADLE
jgi:alanine racemase